jgi:pimeloyl-ACP methyl ester carboxylesterase
MSLKLYQQGTQGPAVLVQGGGPGMSSRIYREIFKNWKERCRLFFWDFRGTGESTPEGPFSTAQDFADLKTLLPQLPESFHVLAHSYGGLLALELAAAFPQRIQSLFLVSTAPTFRVLSAEAPHRLLKKLGAQRAQQYGQLAVQLAGAPGTSEDRFALQELVARFQLHEPNEANVKFIAEHLEYSPMVLFANEDFLTVDHSAVLSAMNVPVRFLSGAQDLVVPIEFLKPLQSTACARFETIPGCGHWPFLEKPAAFEAAWKKHFASAR